MYMVIEAIDLGNMEMSNQRINFAEFSACLMGSSSYIPVSLSLSLSLSPLSLSFFLSPFRSSSSTVASSFSNNIIFGESDVQSFV